MRKDDKRLDHADFGDGFHDAGKSRALLRIGFDVLKRQDSIQRQPKAIDIKRNADIARFAHDGSPLIWSAMYCGNVSSDSARNSVTKASSWKSDLSAETTNSRRVSHTF